MDYPKPFVRSTQEFCPQIMISKRLDTFLILENKKDQRFNDLLFDRALFERFSPHIKFVQLKSNWCDTIELSNIS